MRRLWSDALTEGEDFGVPLVEVAYCMRKIGFSNLRLVVGMDAQSWSPSENKMAREYRIGFYRPGDRVPFGRVGIRTKPEFPEQPIDANLVDPMKYEFVFLKDNPEPDYFEVPFLDFGCAKRLESNAAN